MIQHRDPASNRMPYAEHGFDLRSGNIGNQMVRQVMLKFLETRGLKPWLKSAGVMTGSLDPVSSTLQAAGVVGIARVAPVHLRRADKR
jgi:hypothetical protein